MSRQSPRPSTCRLAAELKGTYLDVNEKQMPTSALGDLVVRMPLPQRGLSLAQLAILAMVAGSASYALIPVGLEYLGSDWQAEPRKAAPRPANRETLAAR